MTTKVKGLFKGLKQISNIFDEKEAEDEIQIGFPTDVKHVAHIGLDGPSANTPTWMTNLKSASEPPELSSALTPAPAPAPALAPTVNSTETNQDNNIKGDRIRNIKEIPRSKPSKDHSNSEGLKHSRHHRSSDASSDSSNRGTRQSRRHRSTNQGGEPPVDDTGEKTAVAPPKHHRRRKSKTANGDGSERSERSSRKSSKGNSLTDISFSDLESVDGSKSCESLV